MLLSFSLENYRSINEKVTLSFIAEPIKEHLFQNAIPIPLHSISVLKSYVLFGPNGTGKSNILHGLSFIIEFLKTSGNEFHFGESIPVNPFKFDPDSKIKPSTFSIEVLTNHEDRFRYSIKLDKKKVYEETLTQILKTTKHELFYRNTVTFRYDQRRFPEGNRLLTTSEGILDNSLVRENAAVLSISGLLKGNIALSIINELNKITYLNHEILNDDRAEKTAHQMEDSQNKILIENFLKSAQLGFDKIDIKKREITSLLGNSVAEELSHYNRRFKKTYYDVNLVYDMKDKTGAIIGQENVNLFTEESVGIKKLFSLAGFLIDATINKKTLVIDEFTSGIHPRLAYYIIKSFHKHSTIERPGQLLIASHNTFLMDENLYRRDQIALTYFQQGHRNTTLKTLHELRVRSDVSFEKKYFSNEFGHLPIFS